MTVGSLAILVLAAVWLAAPFPAAAQSQREYADGLRKQLEQDQVAFTRLVSQVNTARLDSRADAQVLASTLDAAAAQFEASATVYRRPAPSTSSSVLTDSARLAADGAAGIAAGARSAARALRSDGSAEFQTAQRQMNAGAESLRSAVSRYNEFIDAQRSTSGAVMELAESPLKLTMFFGLPIVGLGGYLFLAGYILNGLFHRRLRAHITGADGGRPLRGGPLVGAYGFHLIPLVALAYVLLVFAVVLVADFALLLAWLVSAAAPTVRRIPIMLPIAALVVALGSLWGILRGLLGGVRGKYIGTLVSPAQEPRLWGLSRAVATDVGTSAAHAVVLSPLPGISVHEEGGMLRLLLGRTRRVLTVGVPSIVGLTVGQFRAILGHEYGHFSNRDTSWTSLTFRAGAAVAQTLAVMQATAGAGGWFALLSVLNPALWALLSYRLLFAYATSGFSRMREVFADQAAIRLYGATPFREGLQRVVINDIMFGRVCLPRIRELSREGSGFRGIYEAVERAEREASPETLAEIWHELETRGPSPFDTHPPVPERLIYAERFAHLHERAGASHAADTTPVATLLSSWRPHSDDSAAHETGVGPEPSHESSKALDSEVPTRRLRLPAASRAPAPPAGAPTHPHRGRSWSAGVQRLAVLLGSLILVAPVAWVIWLNWSRDGASSSPIPTPSLATLVPPTTTAPTAATLPVLAPTETTSPAPVQVMPSVDTSLAGQVRYISDTAGIGVKVRSSCDDQSGAGGWPEGSEVVVEYTRSDCPGWFWVRLAANEYSWVRAQYLSATVARSPAPGALPTPTPTRPPVPPTAVQPVPTPAATRGGPLQASVVPTPSPTTAAAREPVWAPAAPGYFTVGSTRDEVISSQGQPASFDSFHLRYGSSYVYLQNGRVSHWANGSPRLNARLIPATPSSRTEFGVGSTRDEVVSVQGQPDAFDSFHFRYGSSYVYFQSGRVTHWSSGSPPLKARL